MNRIKILLATLLCFSSIASAVDVNGQLKNAQLEKLAANPSSNVVEARVYYNTVDKLSKYFNGSVWKTLALTDSPTLSTPAISGGTISGAAISGGTHTGLTQLTLDNPDSSFDLELKAAGSQSAAKSITFNAGGGNRTFDLGGDLILTSGLTTIGSGGISLTTVAGSDVVVPATGTLATLAGVESFTNKTLTSPKVNENVVLTTTATKLNYLTSASGTTGTTSTDIVFSTSPTLITPVLGVASATSINGTSIPSSKTLVVTTDKLSVHASTSSAELAGVLSDESGSGGVFALTTGPTFVTPTLGAATATSINGTTIPSSKTLVVTTDTLAVLAATTSAQLLGVLSDETGSGLSVFNSSPTIAGTLLLQNPSGAQPELHLSEDPDNGTNVVKIKAPATLGGDYTLTLPADDGDASQVLSTNGSGTLSWVSGLTTALTSAHLYVGNVSNVATDVAVTGDVTIDNAGATTIGASKVVSSMINDGTIVNNDINASAAIAYSKLNLATSIVNADVSGSAAIAYSKLNLGTSIVNADISGSAAIVGSKIVAATTSTNGVVTIPTASVICDTGNGYGSGNTRIRRFTNCTTTGTDITLTQNSTNGDKFTIAVAGVYAVTVVDRRNSGSSTIGISVNSSNGSGSITSLAAAERLCMVDTVANSYGSCSATMYFASGDIRVQTDALADNTGNGVQFKIARVF